MLADGRSLFAATRRGRACPARRCVTIRLGRPVIGGLGQSGPSLRGQT